MEGQHPELKGLTPGGLQMWRRQHREEILDYLAERGKQATMGRYRFTHPTAFERFIELEPPPRPNCEQLDRIERAKTMAEMALAGSAENRGEIRQLKEAYQQFVETVGEQLAQKFFMPLVRLAIQLGDNPAFKLPPDPLNLEGWQPMTCDVVAEAEQLLKHEESPSPDDPVSNWIEMSYAYERALDNENWKLALAIHHWLWENEPA